LTRGILQCTRGSFLGKHRHQQGDTK